MSCLSIPDPWNSRHETWGRNENNLLNETQQLFLLQDDSESKNILVHVRNNILANTYICRGERKYVQIFE